MAIRSVPRNNENNEPVRQGTDAFVRYVNCMETQSQVLQVAIHCGVLKRTVGRVAPKFARHVRELSQGMEGLANNAKPRTRRRSTTLALEAAQKARTIADDVELALRKSYQPAITQPPRTAFAAPVVEQLVKVRLSGANPIKRATLEKAVNTIRASSGAIVLGTNPPSRFAPRSSRHNPPAPAQRASVEAELANLKVRLRASGQMVCGLIRTMSDLVKQVENPPSSFLSDLVSFIPMVKTTEEHWPAAIYAMLVSLENQFSGEVTRFAQLQNEVWELESFLGLSLSPADSGFDCLATD